MYAMDTPCEWDIFRIISSIDFDLIHDVIPPKGQTRFGPCAKMMMAAIELLKYLLFKVICACECDVF